MSINTRGPRWSDRFRSAVAVARSTRRDLPLNRGFFPETACLFTLVLLLHSAQPLPLALLGASLAHVGSLFAPVGDILAVVCDVIALIGEPLALVGKPLAPGYSTLSIFKCPGLLIAQHRARFLKRGILGVELPGSGGDIRVSTPDLSLRACAALLHPAGTQPLQLGSVCLQARELSLMLCALPLELGPFKLTALLPRRSDREVALRALLVHAHRVVLTCASVSHYSTDRSWPNSPRRACSRSAAATSRSI